MSSPLAREIANLRLPALALWAPGPHMLTPAVRRVLQTYQATYSHRSTAFQACYQKTVDLLREVFQIPHGFTAAHLRPHRQLQLGNGRHQHALQQRDIGHGHRRFLQKWAQVFTSHGRNIDILKADWGDGICARTWSNAIAKNYRPRPFDPQRNIHRCHAAHSGNV